VGFEGEGLLAGGGVGEVLFEKVLGLFEAGQGKKEMGRADVVVVDERNDVGGGVFGFAQSEGEVEVGAANVGFRKGGVFWRRFRKRRRGGRVGVVRADS
jgi:hypothetical protein